MNFGFSGGDIALVIDLAYKAYSGWKRACGEYADITSSLDVLLTNLERIQDVTEQPNSVLLRTSKDRKDLEEVLSACQPTVRELDITLSKYKSLGRSRQRNWDKLRFGIKNLDELRTKLTSHISAITLYLNTISVASSTRLERDIQALPERIQTAVDYLAEEIRAGRREGSVLTTYGDDEKEVWKQFRRELIGDGMTSGFIHKYKPRIKRYLQDLAERGELEERAPEVSGENDDDEDAPPEFPHECRINEERPLGSLNDEVLESGNVRKERTLPLPQEKTEVAAPTASQDGREKVNADRKTGRMFPQGSSSHGRAESGSRSSYPRSLLRTADDHPTTSDRNTLDMSSSRSQQSSGQSASEQSSPESPPVLHTDAVQSPDQSHATIEDEMLQVDNLERPVAPGEVEIAEQTKENTPPVLLAERRVRFNVPLSTVDFTGNETGEATANEDSSAASVFCPHAVMLQSQPFANFPILVEHPECSYRCSYRCSDCDSHITYPGSGPLRLKFPLLERDPNNARLFRRGGFQNFYPTLRFFAKSHTTNGTFTCIFCKESRSDGHGSDEAPTFWLQKTLMRYLGEQHSSKELEREPDLHTNRG